jgi:predicted ATPase
VLLNCESEQAELLHEEQFLKDLPEPYVAKTISPSDATMLSRLYDLHSNRRANMFKLYLQSWIYFNLNPDALRSPKVLLDRPFFYSDGSNFSKVMYTLHNERPRVERKIIEAVRAIEPKVDVFSFTSPDPQSVYFFLEDDAENRFGPQSISDGTLRYIVFAYLVYSFAEANASPRFSPLVMIEEPENGLYVGHLKPLFEKIDPTGINGQFLFTSHSPYFIDLWENNLQGVHLLKPGKPSSVLVHPEHTKLEKLLDEMPLGELHFREMLA